MKIEFQLTRDNLNEYNIYAVLHDRSLQNKLILLIVSLLLVLVIFSLYVLKMSFIGIAILCAGVAFLIFFFPSIYWKTQINRVERISQNAKVAFPVVQLDVTDIITVRQGEQKFIIHKDDILNIDSTKNLLLLFYQGSDKVNSLMIPLDAIDDVQKLMKMLQEEKKK